MIKNKKRILMIAGSIGLCAAIAIGGIAIVKAKDNTQNEEVVKNFNPVKVEEEDIDIYKVEVDKNSLKLHSDD